MYSGLEGGSLPSSLRLPPSLPVKRGYGVAPITPEFKEKIKELQRSLGVEVDGIIGPDTYGALVSYYKSNISEWQQKNAFLKTKSDKLEDQVRHYREKARGTRPFSIGVILGAVGGFLGALGIM